MGWFLLLRGGYDVALVIDGNFDGLAVFSGVTSPDAVAILLQV